MACAHGWDSWYSRRLRVAGASSSHARAVSPPLRAAPNADAAWAAPVSPPPHALTSNRITAEPVVTRRPVITDLPRRFRQILASVPGRSGEVSVMESCALPRLDLVGVHK